MTNLAMDTNSLLSSPQTGVLTVAAVPTSGQGLALDASGNIPASLIPSPVIQDILLTVATASFDFLAVPQTFRHLRLYVTGHSDQAAPNEAFMLRFNADAGANYSYLQATNHASAWGNSDNAAQTSIGVGNMNGNDPGMPGSTVIDIVNYTSTTMMKNAQARNYFNDGAGNQYDQLYNALWASTAAITRVTVFAGAGKFAAGSRATLVGT